MKVTHGRSALPPPPARGAVVSVGVFDGVHRGHQEILAANRRAADARGAEATVVTFGEHPKGLLLGHAPRTLTSLAHRLELFRRAGMDHTLVLAFDAELRELSAEAFARELCVRELGAVAFVLGFDSKFGRDREGTPAFLRELGLSVEVVGKVEVGGRGVSSTVLREAVELGDLGAAARMLGRPYAVLGDVVRGDGIGRGLGFPTANLDLHHELHPPPGVYAARARPRPEGEPAERDFLPAVVNIGFRPTLGGERPERARVEVHLLGFEGDLYGREVELEFVARLRDEQRFPDLDALRAQIAADVEAARAALAAPGET